MSTDNQEQQLMKETRDNVKEILIMTVKQEEHLKTLNHKTDKTISQQQSNMKRIEALEDIHKEFKIWGKIIKEFKWIVYALGIYVVATVISALFDVPLSEVIGLIKGLI